MFDWGAIISGGSAAGVLILAAIAVMRAMGVRIIQDYDKRLDALEDEAEELREGLQEQGINLRAKTSKTRKQVVEARTEIKEEHQEFQRDTLRSFGNLSEKFVPRKELGTKIDAIKQSQSNMKEDVNKMATSLENLRKHLIQSG